MSAGGLLASAALMAGSISGLAAAQTMPRLAPMPELRIDVIAGRQPALQGGVGLQIPVGYYVRVGVDGAVGGRTGALPSGGRADARFDLLARFLLDPFRQSAYGLSVGGGLSVRAEPGDRVRPLLLVAVDVEGRRSAHGWAPAVQVGLGGGARIGVVMRRAPRVTR
jgi:hypothetical protein